MKRIPTWREILVEAQADGPTLTAAAAASMLPTGMKPTLDPGYFDRVGKMLRFYATGRISSAITTPGSARFDLRLGGTVVWDSLAILLDTAAAHVNVPWFLDVTLTCRLIGPAAVLIGQGTFTSEVVRGSGVMPLGSLVAALPWNSAPAVGPSFDSTAAQTVDAFYTQVVATGSLTLHQAYLEALN